MGRASTRPRRPPRLEGCDGRLGWALALYLVVAIAVFAVMPSSRLLSHSPHNHYTLQAEAWLAGQMDLGGAPPGYTGRNDFAVYEGRTYVSFPPVPAALMLPFVAAAGTATEVRDPFIFASLAPLGPALFFLVLERLRDSGRSRRRRFQHAGLSLLLALGSVYWFSAGQGSVWFAGHVVTMVLGCGYLLASVEARHPLLAGLLLALAFGTRPSFGFALPFFVWEAYRVSVASPRHPPTAWYLGGAPLTKLAPRLVAFALPAAAVLAALAWYNAARFGDPTEFGHRHLDVLWRGRIDAHGLFSFRYLGRNLAVMLTALPFYDGAQGLRVGGHGLALWLTSPFLLWALWPRRARGTYLALALTVVCVASPSLLYQNTGWVQFGYRFSNDFAPLLVMMIAVGGRRLGGTFWLAGAFALMVNAVGAVTFAHPDHRDLYLIDRSQRLVHQPL